MEIKFLIILVCKYLDFVIFVYWNRIMREKLEKGFEEILNKLYLFVFILINCMNYFYFEDML